MAIQMDFTTSFGMVIENAYVKISNTNGDKDKMFLELSVFNIVNEEQMMVGRIYNVLNDTHQFEFVPDVTEGSDNFIKQGYDYIKTLDQFESATDV